MQALLVVVVVLLVLTLVSLWVVIYQLVKQQGRLVLRQDELEGALSQAPPGSTNGRGGGQGPSRGLAIGEQVDSFSLPDLEGRTVRLEDFRGKKVLLVHWSTSCGFCTQIAPELAELQPDLRRRGTELVLVSHGSAENHRALAEEYGLEGPILLLEGGESMEAFSGLGTPAAYLIDKKGKVDHHIAIGADQVPRLAREAARVKKKQEADQEEGKTQLNGEKSLSESRIERDGLKPGTPAPPIRMPDVYGNMVSLEDFRGRRVLLVFSAPECGPCEALAPDLARLHRDHAGNDPVVLMVGQGNLQENRQKAEAHGFDFPVVVQRRWEVSRDYGIFATPVAFLIDEAGVIAAPVARGKEEILELAREVTTTRAPITNEGGSP